MEQGTTRIKAFLIKIWPTFYRMLNTFLYFVLMIIVNGVKRAIQQIKGSM